MHYGNILHGHGKVIAVRESTISFSDSSGGSFSDIQVKILSKLIRDRKIRYIGNQMNPYEKRHRTIKAIKHRHTRGFDSYTLLDNLSGYGSSIIRKVQRMKDKQLKEKIEKKIKEKIKKKIKEKEKTKTKKEKKYSRSMSTDSGSSGDGEFGLEQQLKALVRGKMGGNKQLERYLQGRSDLIRMQQGKGNKTDPEQEASISIATRTLSNDNIHVMDVVIDIDCTGEKKKPKVDQIVAQHAKDWKANEKKLGRIIRNLDSQVGSLSKRVIVLDQRDKERMDVICELNDNLVLFKHENSKKQEQLTQYANTISQMRSKHSEKKDALLNIIDILKADKDNLIHQRRDLNLRIDAYKEEVYRLRKKTVGSK